MNTDNSNDTRIQIVPVCCAPASPRRAIFWGSTLILLGIFLFASLVLPLQHIGRFLLPAFLLLWGAAILLGRQRA